MCVQSLQVAQKEAQIRLLEGQLRQTDVIGSSHNHMILDALREKAEYIPELQALIHNVQQGVLPVSASRGCTICSMRGWRSNSVIMLKLS